MQNSRAENFARSNSFARIGIIFGGRMSKQRNVGVTTVHRSVNFERCTDCVIFTGEKKVYTQSEQSESKAGYYTKVPRPASCDSCEYFVSGAVRREDHNKYPESWRAVGVCASDCSRSAI